MITKENQTTQSNYLFGDSVIAKLLSTTDLNESSVGVVESWPQSLKTLLNISLSSSNPVILWWGEKLFRIHNDSYCDLIKDIELNYMGKLGKNICAEEVSHYIEILTGIFRDGKQVVSKDHSITGNDAELKTSHFTFKYCPIPTDSGAIGGVFCEVTIDLDEAIEERNRLKKIEESYKRYQRMLMESPFAFSIMKGPDSKITLANKQMKDFWGKGNDVEGKTLLKLLPELTDQPFPGIISKVYSTGVPEHLNEVLATLNRHGKREDHYFNIIYQPHYEADENISGVITIAYEVTEMILGRKRLEAQANMVYNLLMTAPGFVTTLTGPDHVYDIVNDRYQSFFGKRHLKGKSILKALPELEGQGFDKLLDRVYQTGQPYLGIDIPIKLASDENLEPQQRYFNFSYQPMFDENNKVYSILVFGYEVTDQMMAKKKIQDSEQQFRTLTNLMPGKITNADATGKVFFYNQSWVDYTGLSTDQLLNDEWIETIYKDDLDKLKTTWETSLKTGNDFDVEFRIKNIDGIYKWHLSKASPVKDNDGNIVMWISVTTDIQKLKDDDKLKDNFISMASHELKTPVTTIKAYGQIAEVMLKKKGDTETLNILERMSGQVSRLMTLINELLDISRIREGKLLYQEELFDFNDFMCSLVEDMRHITETHIIIYSACKNVKVFGDKEKLTQVAGNIISNAIKYSPGAKSINVSSTIMDGGVRVSVEDYGVGISNEARLHVFEQFYRVNGNDQSTFPGMGIGLYVSAQIIKRHSGKIWVERNNPEGTTFCFWIPTDHLK